MSTAKTTRSTLAVGMVWLFSLSLCASLALAQAELTAEDIIKKMDDLIRGKTSHSRMSMKIATPSWTRTIRMESWSEGNDKSFIHILEPARERDITFLKKGRLLYQYLPSAEMRIKISPSMMMQSWMGSDFTNDDLVKESSVVEDYTHKLLGKEAAAGKGCYKLELTAKPDAPVVWGKIVAWVDTEDYLPVREEFFDEKGTKIRVMEFSEVRMTNDRKFPMRWALTPLNKEGHQTILSTEKIEFGAKIRSHVFSLRNLEKPR